MTGAAEFLGVSAESVPNESLSLYLPPGSANQKHGQSPATQPQLGGHSTGLVLCGEVTQQRIADDPHAHVVISGGLGGLAIAADVGYVLAALMWPNHVLSWLVPVLVGVVAALMVQGRRPRSGEQPYRTPNSGSKPPSTCSPTA